MSSQLEALFGAGLLPRTDFPETSRYHGVAVRARTMPDGTPAVYLSRRICPSPEQFATLSGHRIKDGERLDQLTARLLGDPELFWMLCDANGAIWPDELEAENRIVRLTLPAGVDAPGGDT